MGCLQVKDASAGKDRSTPTLPLKGFAEEGEKRKPRKRKGFDNVVNGGEQTEESSSPTGGKKKKKRKKPPRKKKAKGDDVESRERTKSVSSATNRKRSSVANLHNPEQQVSLPGGVNKEESAFSLKEITILKSTWLGVVRKQHDPGSVVLRKMFSVEPSTEKYFADTDLSLHGGRIVSFLDSCFDTLADASNTDPFSATNRLGATHSLMGIPTPLLDAFGKALVCLLKESPQWSSEAASTWLKFWDRLCTEMLAGMSSAPKKSSVKIPTILSEARRKAQGVWERLLAAGVCWETILSGFVVDHPDLRRLFPRSLTVLGTKLDDTMRKLLSLPLEDNPPEAKAIFSTIASKHSHHGVDDKMYLRLFESLLFAVEKAFCDDRPDVRQANISSFSLFYEFCAASISGAQKSLASDTPEFAVLDAETLLSSWEALQGTNFLVLFFERLTQTRAGLKERFSDISLQQRLFAEAMSSLLQHLSEASIFAEKLNDLLARHAFYGITPADYVAAGVVMKSVLEKLPSSTFSNPLSDVQAAWQGFWSHVSEAAGVSAVQEKGHLAPVRSSWQAISDEDKEAIARSSMEAYLKKSKKMLPPFATPQSMAVPFLNMLTTLVFEYGKPPVSLMLGLLVGRHAVYGVCKRDYPLFLNDIYERIIAHPEGSCAKESWKFVFSNLKKVLADAYDKRTDRALKAECASKLCDAWPQLPESFRNGETLVDELLQFTAFRDRFRRRLEQDAPAFGNAVMKAVYCLLQTMAKRDDRKTADYLNTLGEYHAKLKISGEEYDAFGQIFMGIFSQVLGRDLDEEAWVVFSTISDSILAHCRLYALKQDQEEQEVPRMLRAATEKDFAAVKRARLSHQPSSEEAEEEAASFFRKLQRKLESSADLFPTDRPGQVRLFDKVLSRIVEGEDLEALGEAHQARGVRLSAYSAFGQVLLSKLGPMASECKDSWKAVVTQAVRRVSAGHVNARYPGALLTLDHRLLCYSFWERVNRQEVSEKLYKKLFAAAPYLQSLFSDVDRQIQAMVTAITSLITESNDHAAVSSLEELGIKHAIIGVKRNDYDLVGTALLEALQESGGEQTGDHNPKSPLPFDERQLDAWKSLYSYASTIMSAQKAEKARPGSNSHLRRRPSASATAACTREVVGSHCTRNDCWLIIKGKVYDTTEFASRHPGGSSVLIKYAGSDATDEFEKIHSEAAWNQLKALYVADLAD